MGKQYSFNTANVYAIDSITGAPTELMSINDISLEFSRDTKEQTGKKAFAEIVALGKGKVSGKGTIQTYNAKAINLLLSNMGNVTPGQRLWIQEPFTLAAGTPSYTVKNAAKFYKNLGVVDTTVPTNVNPFDFVAANPAAGQYALDPNVKGKYLFSAADASASRSGLASYIYEATAVAGTQTYTVNTNFVATDTITIAGVTLAAVASGATGLQFNVGATAADTAANIKNVLAANTTVNSIYNVTVNGADITLTEITAGGGHTPSNASTTGTGTVTSGPSTASLSVGGDIIELNNPNMAAAQYFAMFLHGDLVNKQNVVKQTNVWLNCCVSSKLSLGWKVEDFNNPSFDFTAFADDLDSLGWLSVGK